MDTQKTSVSIARNAASYIVSLSEGFPTSVHQLGYQSFRLNRGRNIGITDVREALHYIIRESRHEEFSARHQNISPGIEEELISCMVKSRENEIDIGYLSNNMNHSEGNIAGAIESLTMKGFLTRVGRGRFKFCEPLFRIYMRWKEGLS